MREGIEADRAQMLVRKFSTLMGINVGEARALASAHPERSQDAIRRLDELRRESAMADPVASINVSEAERIYFVGFGFDLTNLARLRVNEPLKGASILATAFGKTLAELQPVETFFRPNRIALQREWKAIDVLRNVDFVHD